MNFQQIRQALGESPNQPLFLELPGGKPVPRHFHITEVGKITKNFVDCGGVGRTEQVCVLQTLVAHDTHHQLTTNKLDGILEKSTVLKIDADLEVDVEVQGATIEVYRVADAVSRDGHLVFSLAAKNTACLAMDKCGLDVMPNMPNSGESCCGSQSNCC